MKHFMNSYYPKIFLFFRPKKANKKSKNLNISPSLFHSSSLENDYRYLSCQTGNVIKNRYLELENDWTEIDLVWNSPNDSKGYGVMDERERERRRWRDSMSAKTGRKVERSRWKTTGMEKKWRRKRELERGIARSRRVFLGVEVALSWRIEGGASSTSDKTDK